MMRSLYSGVSGIKGHQTRMDVVGNNIANVNTTGFKSGRVTFADTLSQTSSSAASATGNLGGRNPKQIGLGVGVASIDTLFTDGSVQATGKNTDVAMSGNGLFVVKSGSETYYTRDGAFEFDEKGNYVLPGSGHFVQGWTASNGSLNTNGAIGNIQIEAGKSMPSAVTTTATYKNNLNAAKETVIGMKLTDAKGNSITLDSTNTNSYTVGVGNTYTATVRKAAVTFASGISLPSAQGTYAMGQTYYIPNTTSVTVNLANGDEVTVPYNSAITWRVGSDVPSATNPVKTLNVSSTNTEVTLDDNSTIANKSGSSYKVELLNGDTIEVPANSTQTAAYTVGTNAPADTITSITGNSIKLASGATMTNNSGTPYEVSDGTLKIKISSQSTKTYDTTNALNLTIMSVNGSQATLSDGSTLVLTPAQMSTGTYVPGYSFNFTATVAGMPTLSASKVSSISAVSPSAITRISGTVDSADGTTTSTDTFNVTSGYITPLSGLKVSELTLTDSLGSSIKVSNSDTTGYKAGTTTYASDISSILLDMSDGTTSTHTSGKYTMGYSLPLTTTLNVYDTLGNAHTVVVYFTKTKTDSVNGNQWTAAVNIDGSGKNTITEPDGSTTTIEMSDTVLQFNTNGKYSDGSGTLNLKLTNGSTATQTLTIDVSQLTQYSGNNTINGVCNGNAAGTLKSIAIDSSGIITGTYTNGVSQAEAQIAVAQFTNASGLTKTGTSLYQQSNNSGEPNVKTAADLGVTLQASALEMSNVDIANEFSDMIITQRGFQSNSKIVTVSDEMLETMINMKR
ncbi:flagellar hook protein FlgE [Selenomonas ruminantium]|uniref:Flagellar hook protein FlgE n=1 Tax=Selenomonas ruminantium TaxID=971 RepID=A0A1M6V365_SELRU|nr:flagellar hook-basal body complex protein [Selenomonas ruminantium]SHK75844.1 flagellar hook protein FlgE [Selenomonas ruminantium]